MSDRIEGKIAAILDNTTVVINRGVAHNVSRGDIFYIYSKIGPFYDPDTDEDLGETTRIWGKVEVTILEEKFCIAKTEYRNPFVFNLPASLFQTSRIQLPVDEDDITYYLEKIQVGFPVISQRQQAKEIEEEDVKTLPDSTTSENDEQVTSKNEDAE